MSGPMIGVNETTHQPRDFDGAVGRKEVVIANLLLVRLAMGRRSEARGTSRSREHPRIGAYAQILGARLLISIGSLP